MNKFDFVIKERKTTKAETITSCLFYKEFRRTFDFAFNDEVDNFANIVEDRPIRRSLRTSGRIVKSDIQEHVIKQMKNMLKEIKDCGEEVLYLCMNKNTKKLFRMYYNYEVDHVPRNISNEDKRVGQVVGTIMGIKIILDNLLIDNLVKPIVKNDAEKKFAKIFETN
jgi:hypothetical protein